MNNLDPTEKSGNGLGTPPPVKNDGRQRMQVLELRQVGLVRRCLPALLCLAKRVFCNGHVNEHVNNTCMLYFQILWSSLSSSKSSWRISVGLLIRNRRPAAAYASRSNCWSKRSHCQHYLLYFDPYLTSTTKHSAAIFHHCLVQLDSNALHVC